MSNSTVEPLDLEKICEKDFDFLSDTAFVLVLDTLDFTEASDDMLSRIKERLDPEKYDISIELNEPSNNWWQENVLPDLLSSDDFDENEQVTLELNIISTTQKGSHAGERVIVASLYCNVNKSLENIKAEGLINPVINWLPELAD